jgi:hypothetical protein
MISWPSFFVGMAAMIVLSLGVVLALAALAMTARPRRREGNIVFLAGATRMRHGTKALSTRVP